jgi:nucleoside-diphosphate-sugar epimerase
MTKTALIAGVSGITGQNLAEHLASQPDWQIYGLARKEVNLPGVKPMTASLLELDTLKTAFAGWQIEYVFFSSWQRMESEERNCEVNGAMLRNLLVALEKNPVKHVALVTGGKNYFGSFDDSGKFDVITPYREEQTRKPGLNFYYTQEDVLFERARGQGFSWSVHRPNTIVGYAVGNLMNMASTLACYAAICKESNRPFVFPGSPTIYYGVCDASDARILAKHLHWTAETEAAKNHAFNVVNGDVYRWNWMWQELANYFGLEAAPYSGEVNALEKQMADAAPVWDRIVQKHNLQPRKLEELASWWHTDSDLSRSFETFADMSKSRKLGFLEYQKTNESFFNVFDRMRSENLIPSK